MMPAKWQQWMPFHIDRFKASPAVQAMHPAARSGYLYLLSCCWQSEDCTISGDDLTLAELSGLGDELWKVHSAKILRKFAIGPDNRLMNLILREEWEEARRVYEARQASAQRTNTVRSSNGHRSVTERSPSRSADTRTLTLTSTDTKEQKTIARSVPPEELAGTLPLVDGSEYQVSKSQIASWKEAFPAIDVKTELKAMKAWLEANPKNKKTAKGIARFAVSWLGRAQNKAPRISGHALEPVKTPYQLDLDRQMQERRAAREQAGL